MENGTLVKVDCKPDDKYLDTVYVPSRPEKTTFECITNKTNSQRVSDRKCFHFGSKKGKKFEQNSYVVSDIESAPILAPKKGKKFGQTLVFFLLGYT